MSIKVQICVLILTLEKIHNTNLYAPPVFIYIHTYLRDGNLTIKQFKGYNNTEVDYFPLDIKKKVQKYYSFSVGDNTDKYPADFYNLIVRCFF